MAQLQLKWESTEETAEEGCSLEYSESMGSSRASFCDLFEQCLNSVQMVRVRKSRARNSTAKKIIERREEVMEEQTTLRFGFNKKPSAKGTNHESNLSDEKSTPKVTRKRPDVGGDRHLQKSMGSRLKSVSTDRSYKIRPIQHTIAQTPQPVDFDAASTKKVSFKEFSFSQHFKISMAKPDCLARILPSLYAKEKSRPSPFTDRAQSIRRRVY